MDLRNYNAALADWDALWDRYPGSPEIAHWTGSTLVRLGRLDEAEAAFKHGLRIDPDNLLLTDSLARTLIRKGDLIGATKFWELHQQAQPNSEFSPNLRLLQRQIDRAGSGPGHIGATNPLQNVWGPYYFSIDLDSWRMGLDCTRCVDTESEYELIKSQVTDYSLPRRFAKWDKSLFLQTSSINHLLINEVNAHTKNPNSTDRRFLLVLIRNGEPLQLIRPRTMVGQQEPLPDLFPGDELLPVLYTKRGTTLQDCDENIGVSAARFSFEKGRWGVNPKLVQELRLFEANEGNSTKIRKSWELLVLPSTGPITVQEGVYHFKATGMCPADTLDRALKPYDIALPVRSKNPMGQMELAKEFRGGPYDLRTTGRQENQRSLGGTWYEGQPAMGLRAWDQPGKIEDGFQKGQWENNPRIWPYGTDYLPGAGGPPALPDPMNLEPADPAAWPWGLAPGETEEYAKPWVDPPAAN